VREFKRRLNVCLVAGKIALTQFCGNGICRFGRSQRPANESQNQRGQQAAKQIASEFHDAFFVVSEVCASGNDNRVVNWRQNFLSR
jgi:hypothetical protein